MQEGDIVRVDAPNCRPTQLWMLIRKSSDSLWHGLALTEFLNANNDPRKVGDEIRFPRDGGASGTTFTVDNDNPEMSVVVARLALEGKL